MDIVSDSYPQLQPEHSTETTHHEVEERNHSSGS